jgi:type IV fimbrial biogenesis protein FimT
MNEKAIASRRYLQLMRKVCLVMNQLYRPPKNYTAQKNFGFTLIELLIVICIISILAIFVIPLGRHLLQQQKIQRTKQIFLTMLQFAQQAAVNENNVVSICPTRDHLTCTKDWHQEKIVFLGIYDQAHPELPKKILRVFPPTMTGEFIIQARGASQTPTSWRFAAPDFNQNQNGSFSYCLAEKGWKIVINRLGRIRTEDDLVCAS